MPIHFQATPGQLPQPEQWGGILITILVVLFGPIVLAFIVALGRAGLEKLRAPRSRRRAKPGRRLAVRRSGVAPRAPRAVASTPRTVEEQAAAPTSPLRKSRGVTAAAPTAPVSLGTWLQRANNAPDRSPHLAVVGPSGSGKTTLVLATLATRPGRILICTPKSQRADPWGGFPAVRLRREDMSFAPIAAAISAVYQEMLRRNASEADVEDDWLTLVVDEYSTVIGKIPEASSQVLDLVTMGRSSRIRVILLATELNVKSWGWEGRGEARHNCLFVECEEETHRAAMFRWGKAREPIDTARIPSLAERAKLADRAWAPPAPSTPAEAVATAEAAAATTPAEPAARIWTDQHVQVAIWLSSNPKISTREIARRLFNGNSGGDWSRKAQAVRDQVSIVFHGQLNAETPVSEGEPAASSVSSVSAPDKEPPEALTVVPSPMAA